MKLDRDSRVLRKSYLIKNGSLTKLDDGVGNDVLEDRL